MSTTVTYKGSVIATVSNAVKKLLTKGKYLEDDITITDSGGGGSAVLETLQVSYTPSETAISDTQTPSQGYDGFDEAQISVAAIPSSYVGSGITRRDSTDMSVSGDTVTAPAGYYENAGSKAVPAGSISLPQFLAANRGSLSSGSGYVGITKTLNITPSVVAGYIASGMQESVEVTLEADVWTVGATNYHPSTSDQTIPADSFLRGAQTIKAVQLTNLLAANIKSGVTVKVGDDTDDDCVTAVTGTLEGAEEITVTVVPTADTVTLTIPVGSFTLPTKYIVIITADIPDGDPNRAYITNVFYAKATRSRTIATSNAYIRMVTTRNTDGGQSSYTSKTVTVAQSGTNVTVKVNSTYYKKDATYIAKIYNISDADI